MAKHFGPQNMANGYAAMGNANVKGRPIYKAANRKRTVGEAIADARHQAAKEVARKSKKN